MGFEEALLIVKNKPFPYRSKWNDAVSSKRAEGTFLFDELLNGRQQGLATMFPPKSQNDLMNLMQLLEEEHIDNACIIHYILMEYQDASERLYDESVAMPNGIAAVTSGIWSIDHGEAASKIVPQLVIYPAYLSIYSSKFFKLLGRSSRDSSNGSSELVPSGSTRGKQQELDPTLSIFANCSYTPIGLSEQNAMDIVKSLTSISIYSALQFIRQYDQSHQEELLLALVHEAIKDNRNAWRLASMALSEFETLVVQDGLVREVSFNGPFAGRAQDVLMTRAIQTGDLNIVKTVGQTLLGPQALGVDKPGLRPMIKAISNRALV